MIQFPSRVVCIPSAWEPSWWNTLLGCGAFDTLYDRAFLVFFCLFVLANLIHQWIFSFSYRFTWAWFVSLYVYFLFGGDGDARFCLHPRVPCATCGPRFWDFRRRLRWRHAEAKNAGLSRAFREWVKLPRRISKSEIEKGEIAPRTGRCWCASSRTRKQPKQKLG